MTTIKDRAMQGAEKYLKMTGRELLYNQSDVEMLVGFDDILVYIDDDEVCIGKVCISTNKIGDETHDNRITVKQFEEVLNEVIYNNDYVLDKPVRPDLIELYVVGNDRAIIKHTQNSGCFGW